MNEKIGKKVRIKNYLQYRSYEGKIGTVTKEEEDDIWRVIMEDGKELMPYSPYVRYAQCELVEEEFVLPEKWAVKRDEDNAAILNKWNNDKYCGGSDNAYRTVEAYMYSDRNYQLDLIPGYTLISFEEFERYVLKKEQEFKLPAKWVINRTTSEEWETITTWFNEKGKNRYFKRNMGCPYMHFPENGCASHNKIREGYTEITFEQFKKYILKENIMKKEIIGYKFKPNCERFKKAAFEIVQPSDIEDFEAFKEKGQYVNMIANCPTKTKLEKAGILDLWFEPVYEEDKIEINSYTAEISADKVKFGCQEFTKGTLLGLKDFLSRTEFRANITVNNVSISLETINKILNQMK